jgi:N-acetylglucosaminyl-diphospho-decaprenol L-rhamnosyltransferase
LVEGPDLEPFAGQEAGRELAPCVEEDGGGVEGGGRILLRLVAENSDCFRLPVRWNVTNQPTIYIPNLNGRDRLVPLLESLRAQSRPARVAIVDNGSADGSQELLRSEYGEVELIELGENLGFGPALNRAVAAGEGDPVVLVNNDVVCEPSFLEALLEPAAAGAEMVAGVLLAERDPGRIDSAGVIADRTLMGFDYLNGEPREAARSAPAPLGPTGGAALYSRAAFDAVGGFDERIFLYYEDLDLALRLRAGGARCELAPAAAAVHAYSHTLGPASGAKYARTGWSRGYMLRRYGVMGRPRDALRVLAAEGAICAGQMVRDRTAEGLRGRLRGWRDAGGLPGRRAAAEGLSDLTLREALALRRARRGPS